MIKFLLGSVCVGEHDLTSHEGIVHAPGVVELIVVSAPKQIAIIKMNSINFFYRQEENVAEYDKMGDDL